MKLCIPVEELSSGVDAHVAGHFGSAPGFVLYDIEAKTLQALSNPKAEHEHGRCRPLEVLSGKGVDTVVCKGMGRNAMTAVTQAGIKVFVAQGATVDEVLDEFMQGQLVKLDPANACRGHHGH